VEFINSTMESAMTSGGWQGGTLVCNFHEEFKLPELHEHVLDNCFESPKGLGALLSGACSRAVACIPCCDKSLGRNLKKRKHRKVLLRLVARPPLNLGMNTGKKKNGPHAMLQHLKMPLQMPLLGVSGDSNGDDENESKIRELWLSPLSAETYHRIRIEMVLPLFQQKALWASRLQNVSQVLIFVIGFMCSALAAFGYSVWVPVLLAFSSMISSDLAFHGTLSFLVGINQASSILHGMCVEWKGYSKVERRMQDLKEKMIVNGEKAIISVTLSTILGGGGEQDGGETNSNKASKETDQKENMAKKKIDSNEDGVNGMV